MIGQILSTLLPVFLIAGCGALYGRYRTPDIQGLNVLNMELFVPMLVFAVLADQKAPLQDYASLALAATVVVLGSGIVLYPLARILNLNLKTFLPPMMFNNSGNMGIPLMVLAFGEAALPAAVVLFIVEMLLHFSVGLYMLDPHSSLIQRLKLPIVFASIAGLAVNLGGVHLPDWLLEALNMLGGVTGRHCLSRQRSDSGLAHDCDSGSARNAGGHALGICRPATGGTELHCGRAVPAGAPQGGLPGTAQ